MIRSLVPDLVQLVQLVQLAASPLAQPGDSSPSAGVDAIFHSLLLLLSTLR